MSGPKPGLSVDCLKKIGQLMRAYLEPIHFPECPAIESAVARLTEEPTSERVQP